MNTDKIISLFDSYADDLYRFALSYTGSRQETEDIVQDVFLKLLSKKIFINNDYEKSYLFKMTANMCRDYLKSKRVKNAAEYDEAMENLIKSTFDKIEMDSEAKEAVRDTLLHERKPNYSWIRYAACADAALRSEDIQYY